MDVDREGTGEGTRIFAVLMAPVPDTWADGFGTGVELQMGHFDLLVSMPVGSEQGGTAMPANFLEPASYIGSIACHQCTKESGTSASPEGK